MKRNKKNVGVYNLSVLTGGKTIVKGCVFIVAVTSKCSASRAVCILSSYDSNARGLLACLAFVRHQMRQNHKT